MYELSNFAAIAAWIDHRSHRTKPKRLWSKLFAEPQTARVPEPEQSELLAGKPCEIGF